MCQQWKLQFYEPETNCKLYSQEMHSIVLVAVLWRVIACWRTYLACRHLWRSTAFSKHSKLSESISNSIKPATDRQTDSECMATLHKTKLSIWHTVRTFWQSSSTSKYFLHNKRWLYNLVYIDTVCTVYMQYYLSILVEGKLLQWQTTKVGLNKTAVWKEL